MNLKNLTHYLILVELGLIISCGHIINDLIYKKGSPRITRTTDIVFQKYLDQLPLSSHTPIVFEDKTNNIAGTCTSWSDGYSEIQIDRTYWNKINDMLRLELLAHEIGHCDYGLMHNDNLKPNGCPVSVMYSTNFNEINGVNCFENDFNYYMEQFEL